MDTKVRLPIPTRKSPRNPNPTPQQSQTEHSETPAVAEVSEARPEELESPTIIAAAMQEASESGDLGQLNPHSREDVEELFAQGDRTELTVSELKRLLRDYFGLRPMLSHARRAELVEFIRDDDRRPSIMAVWIQRQTAATERRTERCEKTSRALDARRGNSFHELSLEDQEDDQQGPGFDIRFRGVSFSVMRRSSVPENTTPAKVSP